MADASDVAVALLNFLGQVIYPNGSDQPSIIGAGVKIYRGWPVAAQLDSDLAANVVNVSIFSPPGMERNTTRYPRDPQVTIAPVHTLTAAVQGNTITIGGTVAVPQNVIALCGTKYAFAYVVQSSDTLASIAANLAALIAAQFPGTLSNGDLITVEGEPGILQARIAAVATVWTEQKRQEKVFWITCWCPYPAIRDALASDIDAALSQLDFITLPDNSAGRLIYNSSRESDEGEKSSIYRRDLLYSVEYATSTVSSAYETGTVGLTTGAQQQTTYV